MDTKKKNMKIIIFGDGNQRKCYWKLLFSKKVLKSDKHEILLFVKNKKSKEKLSKLLNFKKNKN